MRRLFALFTVIVATFCSVHLLRGTQNPNLWIALDQLTIPSNIDLDCQKAQNVSLTGGILTLTVTSGANTCAGGRDYGPLAQTFTTGSIYLASQNFALPLHADFRAKFGGSNTHSTVWLAGTAGQANNPFTFKQFDGGSLWCATDNEIDVGEALPALFGNVTTVRQTLCTAPGQTFQSFDSTGISDYTANFHVYGVDIAGGVAIYCIDGVQKATTSITVPANGYTVYPLITTEIAVGGGSYPQTMQVSYARIGASTGNCTQLTAAAATKLDEEFGAVYGGTVIK